MKYLVLTLVVLVAVGCSSSNISLTTNIPESQVDIQIKQRTKRSNYAVVIWCLLGFGTSFLPTYSVLWKRVELTSTSFVF